jgi:hypothetical protein
MTILPLVERELRVRARSPAGYWTRFGAALAGTLLCVSMLTMYANPALMGAYVFDGLIAAAFILCSFAGFLTVDGISRERREGTLGLLFLTRVRPLDVLLGNFGAAGLASLCALAAFVPVLIVPVLAGGVNGGEAARKVLALFDTMLLSLAAGLWASAGGREWWRSARSAASLLALVMFGPVLLGLLFPLFPLLGFWWPGPLSALSAADDSTYRRSAAPYWISIAVVHAISWLLIVGAAMRLRGTLGEKEEAPAKSVRRAPRRKPLAPGEAPLEWLMRRQRGVKAVVWAGVLVRMFLHDGSLLFLAFFRRGLGVISWWGMSVAVNAVEGCLFGWVASRFFVEARRTGELELLLTTPEGAKTTVASQWNWLKKIFRWPLIVLIVPYGLLCLIMEWDVYARSWWASFFGIQLLLFAVNTLAGIAALLWVGMWFGWSERSQARAIIRIVLVAVAVPFLISIFGPKVVSLFMPQGFGPGSITPWHIPPVVHLLYYLWLIRWAKRKLKFS